MGCSSLRSPVRTRARIADVSTGSINREFILRVGSRGAEVVRLQQRLHKLGFYRGPLDGLFGGGTDSAVRAFQKSAGLDADGIVGPKTWKALMGTGVVPAPDLLSRPLDHRCMALTGAFETGTSPPECFCCLSGDFDEQGISFGVLQWNLGQGSLQPLLLELDRKHSEAVDEVFHENARVLREMLRSERREQLDWSRTIQDPRKHLFEPWRGQFKTLGRLEEFQDIEVAAARGLFAQARALCSEFAVSSRRALALMFDIKVQNGSIQPLVKAQIESDFARLPGSLQGAELEVARLRIVANRRAEASNPRWIEDVRRRKLTIANGKGVVHGMPFDLERQFGIDLENAGSPSSTIGSTPQPPAIAGHGSSSR